MSDPNLPFQPFAKTPGYSVNAEDVKDSCYGFTSRLEPIEAEVSHGETCTFLIIRTSSSVQYFSFEPENTSVLGHALMVAVGK